MPKIEPRRHAVTVCRTAGDRDGQ